MLVCCVSYINGGISKVLNNRPLLAWLDGKALQKATFCSCMVRNIYKGVGYPWLARQVALHRPVSQLLCVLTLLFELPLSFSALLGPGSFGKLGPVRILWCLTACSFHFGVNLLWGNSPASMYNYETWVILVKTKWAGCRCVRQVLLVIERQAIGGQGHCPRYSCSLEGHFDDSVAGLLLRTIRLDDRGFHPPLR
ncbi:Cyt-b5 [Symbiodinium sp. CCMP2456]|nr:Cyt-b5 [Symbiodinium sp. CCMP2456]